MKRNLAQRRLNLNRLTILVVGDDRLFAEPLSVFGKVTHIRVSKLQTR